MPWVAGSTDVEEAHEKSSRRGAFWRNSFALKCASAAVRNYSPWSYSRNCSCALTEGYKLTTIFSQVSHNTSAGTKKLQQCVQAHSLVRYKCAKTSFEEPSEITPTILRSYCRSPCNKDLQRGQGITFLTAQLLYRAQFLATCRAQLSSAHELVSHILNAVWFQAATNISKELEDFDQQAEVDASKHVDDYEDNACGYPFLMKHIAKQKESEVTILPIMTLFEKPRYLNILFHRVLFGLWKLARKFLDGVN